MVYYSNHLLLPHFSLLFIKKWPAVSAILYFYAGYLIIEYLKLPLDAGVLWLYKLHILAFPVGVFIGVAFDYFKFKNHGLLSFRPERSEVEKSPSQKRKTQIIIFTLLSIISSSLLYLSYYLGVHSAVGQGQWPEQNKSVLIVVTVIAALMLLPFEFRIFSLIGVYSFEIYMLHWPIMYRYDFLYKFLPAGMATILYIFVFVAFGYFLQFLTKLILRPKRN